LNRRILAAAWACTLVLALGESAVASAQTTGQTTSETEVVPFVRDVTRIESWSFFDPPPGGGDPTYATFGNRATLGVRVQGRRFDVQGAFQYSQLVGLPRRAVGPGPLGPGALYFGAARMTRAFQLYFKALSLRLKGLTDGFSVEIGRMGYASGAESASRSTSVEIVKRERLASRLIGEVEWSMFERAFDGVRIDLDRARWHTTAAFFLPTQGGFEESANPTMSEVRLGTATLTLKRPTSDFQIFAHHYDDDRKIQVRPDNTGLPITRADIAITTLGASQVAAYPVKGGEIDVVVWAAGQAGDWYGDRHRAVSMIGEVGYHWASAWRPWLRAGVVYASGDDDAADYRHGTFFPMLPTTDVRWLSATYAQMNVRDTFAQLRLQPLSRIQVSADVHALSLVSTADRWYSGSGATARTGGFFGYSGRLSHGATKLSTLIEGPADVALTKEWSLRVFLAGVQGGEVVRRQFAGDRLAFFSFESALRF